MTHRTRTVLELALPIMGAMVSQNIMNLVDTYMVGTLGDAALAAVGLSSFVNFMAQAFLMGLSLGVQAMAARRFGEGARDTMAIPLNGGLLFAALLGIPLSALLFSFADRFYPLLNDDPAVIANGVPYLRARLVAMTAVAANFAFRGYFNGVNRPRIYLGTLLGMHVCNVVISYAFIYGEWGFPKLGATGAGVGTAIATYLGMLIYGVTAWFKAREAGFLVRLPNKNTLRSMLRVAVPSGIRQLFFAAGLTAQFWIVGRVGTTELAAANVLINVMLVAILPGVGLGLAAASLAGQALGRGDPADAKQWGWDVVRIAIVVLGLIGLPMLLVPDWLLSLFIRDPDTVRLAIWPLRIVGATIAIDGVGLVLQNAIQGAGDSRRAMVVSIAVQWGLFLPTAWLVGPVAGFGLVGIWIAMASSRVLQAVCFGALWNMGKWAKVKL